MSEILRTEPNEVGRARVTAIPKAGLSSTGYGGKIPTRYLLFYAGRERRVYLMSYGNGASPYVIVKGQDVFLDSVAEEALSNV